MKSRMTKQKKKTKTNFLAKVSIALVLVLIGVALAVTVGVDTPTKEKTSFLKEETTLSVFDYQQEIEGSIDILGTAYQSMYDDYSVQNFNGMRESVDVAKEAERKFEAVKDTPKGYQASHQSFEIFFSKQSIINDKIMNGINNQDWTYMYSEEFTSDLDEAKRLLDDAIMSYNEALDNQGEDLDA